MKKLILDACCGCRMFWFNKEHPNVIYMDNRECDEMTFDNRRIHVAPDVKGDFRNMPFADNSFRMVVFDPPHLKRAGEKSWLAKKYGRSVAQICIRWSLQRGYLPLPKSVTPVRIRENLQVFDFELAEEDVQLIADLKGCVGYASDPDNRNF